MGLDPFIGEITMFAGNFAPRGYALCQGQILPIAQNTALFSILGTTYGGNGQTTFGLPDLRGRVPTGQGQGPGLPAVQLGELAGLPSHTLLTTEMPAHNHIIRTVANDGNESAPTGYPAIATVNGATVSAYSTANPDASLNPNALTAAGGSQPFDIRQPYLGINFIIALEGVFPSRN